jgi:hypothetical protein
MITLLRLLKEGRFGQLLRCTKRRKCKCSNVCWIAVILLDVVDEWEEGERTEVDNDLSRIPKEVLPDRVSVLSLPWFGCGIGCGCGCRVPLGRIVDC